MFDNLYAYHDLGVLALRLVLAVIFIYHAWPKLTNPTAMAAGVGMSAGLVRLLGLVELLAGIGVGLGLFIHWAALAMIFTMLGALYYKIAKWKVSFWSMTNTGWEFDLLILAAAFFLFMHGAGESLVLGGVTH